VLQKYFYVSLKYGVLPREYQRTEIANFPHTGLQCNIIINSVKIHPFNKKNLTH